MGVSKAKLNAQRAKEMEMAKARKAPKGSKARLAEKQAEAAVIEKEDSMTATKAPETAKKAKKSAKANKKPTVAELREKALRKQAEMARLEAQILEAENPELSNLTAKLDAATKDANAHNRFIAMREKRIRTVTRELDELKNGRFSVEGKLLKAGLKQLREDRALDQARVARITAEIEAARNAAGSSVSDESSDSAES